MALRETHIDVQLTANADPLREMNQQINQITRNTRIMAHQTEGLTTESHRMLQEMKDDWQQQRRSMLHYRNDMIYAEYQYHNLAKSSKDYNGTIRDFEREIYKAGAAQKKVTDAMMVNNDRMRMGIYRTIGLLANQTTMARRNIDSIKSMRNPLYLANLAGLKVVDTLQQIANKANPAAIALRRLGTQASTKQLQDEVMRINRGLGAMNIALIIAGLGAIVFYKGMHKMAMGNKEYAQSFEKMKKAVRKAIQPMVDVFSMIMIPIFKFITGIADLIIKFNEAHPTIAKMLQGVILLVPALTLLLLPLGLGVGLINGYKLALRALMMFAGPVITFFATLSGTVWLVAGVIVLLVAGFIYMYKKFDWFRNGVHAILNGLKNGFMFVFNFIKQIVLSIVGEIVSFASVYLSKLRAFWDENGQQIMLIVKAYFTNIKLIIMGILGYLGGMFKFYFSIIVAATKVAWGLIKMTISTVINLVLGIIRTTLAILRGDWDGAWQAIKGTFVNIWNDIVRIFKDMDLKQIGIDLMNGLISGITQMGSAVGKTVKGIVDNIKGTFTKMLGIHSPSKVFMEYGVNTFQGYGIGMEKERQHIQSVTYDMANIPASYTPDSTVSNTSNSSSKSVVYSPVIHVNAGNGSDKSSIKQAVKEALEESYGYLGNIYEPEVNY
jgi:phage-related protein